MFQSAACCSGDKDRIVIRAAGTLVVLAVSKHP